MVRGCERQSAQSDLPHALREAGGVGQSRSEAAQLCRGSAGVHQHINIMDTEQPQNTVNGVPRQAFEQFLEALKNKGVSSEIVERLQKTLIERGDVSEAAIKAA